jgi:hypothetical protein
MPNKIPGLAKYPDLMRQAMTELKKVPSCCGGRQQVLRKYSTLVVKREQEENERRKIIPHKGSRRASTITI